METFIAEMPTGLVLVVLSRVILAVDARLRESKTGLLIGTASVTLPVMLTLAFTGADDQLIQEFVFVSAIGGLLILWDWARLRASRQVDEPVETVATPTPEAAPSQTAF
jgi:hypothetical protein